MSEIIDGGLGFRAYLDIDDFNVSAEAMERRIRNVSNTAVYESDRMEQSILSFAQNGAKYLVSYLVGNGLSNVLNSIIQVRGQFQQLDIAFETMLGNTAKSKALMDQLVDTAAKTPFDLMGVAGGAKQLLAYGTAADKVNDTLVRLGNIASGLSIPLNDIVYLYGTTQVQGRLYAQDVRQFTGRGIPLVRELAEMYGKTAEEINEMVSAGKIGFDDVEKVILKMTNSGGQFFNLMEKQSASLTGMIANLGDSWDMALNKLGEDNQDVFATGIEGATYLVEHLDDILQAVKAITVAYGSYKAAIVLNTLVTKGYTGVSLIDNTVRQAKVALMKTDVLISGESASITKKMEEAEKAYIATMQTKISLEQHEQALHKIKVSAINEILTADQKRYLSNKGLSSSSKEYVEEATSVLSVEQKMVLNKQDLSTKSRAYADTIADMAKTNEQNVKSLEKEAKLLSERIPQLEDNRRTALLNLEIAREENIEAKAGENAKRKLTAERNLAIQTQRAEVAASELNAASTRKEKIEKELATIATKNGTAAGATDIITKTAQTASTNILTAATNKLKLAMATLWASMKANPLGWIISLVGIAYSAFSYFSNKAKETEDNLSGLAKATKNATDEFNKQASKVDALQKVINNGNIAYDERTKALKELKGIIPGYNAELTKEGTIINNNTAAINEYLTALERQIKLKAAQEELEAAYKKKRELEKTETTQSDKYWDIRQNNTLQGYNRNGAIAKFSRLVGLESENNAKEDLDKTKKDLKDINNEIESLNSEIQSSSSSINESAKEVKSYAEQVSEAKSNIHTLTQKLKNLRSGKVSKNNLAVEIEAKEKELKDAQNKLYSLTGNKGSEVKDLEQLAEKQIQATIKLEQARIEVLEDGYEKRKAILDLQHKQNLLDIEKEEKDLEKARKAAGSGGLTNQEKQSYSERKSLANESYEKDSNKLFIEEIDYKKSQYQLYLRWVQAMDKDTADKRFSELLKGGSSYKEYLEHMMENLKAKKAAGTITSGEQDQLYSLNIQYGEMSGAKTAMDLFKESITGAISQASTLAEKIDAIAKAKDKLSGGGYGLINADEIAEANLILNKSDIDTQRELQETVIKDFKSFEEKRLAIQKEYATYRESKAAQGNATLLAEINKGEAEALSTLNAQMLMQTDSWKNLFTDLDALTVEQIDKLINEIQTKMSTADLNLNPADLKAVLDKLDEAKRKILDVNPFKALGNAIKGVFGTAEQKSKHSSGDIKKDWSNLATATEGTFDFINDAIDGCDVLSDLIGESGKQTIQMVQGVAMAGIAMSAAIKTAEKGSVVLAAIGVALQVVTVVASLFNNDDKLEKRIQSIQANIDALSNSYSRLSNALSHTYWEFSDEERAAHEKRINLINEQIAALELEKRIAASNFDFSKYALLTKQIKDLRYQLEKTEQSGDIFDLYDLQKKNLEERKVLIDQQIQAEKDKKKTDHGKIADWEEEKKKIDTELEDMERSVMETLAGTDVKSAIDEFADALVDAYVRGEDAAKALGEVTKNVMKKAVVEALKRQYLAKGIEEAVQYLGSSKVWEDDVMDDKERAEFERLANKAGDKFNSMLGALGDWMKDIDEEKAEDPLTGAVRGLSEETGSLVAGRLNAVVINQSDSLSVIRQSLIYHQQTAANTGISARELTEIRTTLNTIKNSMGNNALLSQGIS